MYSSKSRVVLCFAGSASAGVSLTSLPDTSIFAHQAFPGRRHRLGAGSHGCRTSRRILLNAIGAERFETEGQQPNTRAIRASSRMEMEAVRSVWQSAGWSVDDADDEHDTEYVLAENGEGRALGAGRLLRRRNNAKLDRVYVISEAREKGVGRAVVECLMRLSSPVEGVVYVEASPSELGFYSLLGFEAQGNQYVERGVIYRHMVYTPPICSPANDCVGLHHTVRAFQSILVHLLLL